jgi:hypothetical protein
MSNSLSLGDKFKCPICRNRVPYHDQTTKLERLKTLIIKQIIEDGMNFKIINIISKLDSMEKTFQYHGKSNLIQFLIKNSISINYIAHILMTQIDFQTMILDKDILGYNCLHYACKGENESNALYLIKHMKVLEDTETLYGETYSDIIDNNTEFDDDTKELIIEELENKAKKINEFDRRINILKNWEF